MAKKKKSPPKIPEPQQVTPQTVPSLEKPTLQYQPFSFEDYGKLNDMVMQQQMKYAPQIMDLYNLSAQKNAATRMALNQQYSLPLAQLRNQQLEAVDPNFMAVNRQLGAQVQGDLNLGYQLGPGLTRELQQGIRGAQTARGNVLGAAPTAQEAFGEGQASLAMYNQRLSNAQNYLQGRQPTDLWPALNATEAYNPNNAYVDQSLGAQAANTIANSQANYNQSYANIGNAYNEALIQSTSVNNSGMIEGAKVNQAGMQTQYQNQWDQYLYKQALSAGILTQPGVAGGGGAGAMGMIGQGLSGAGSLLGAASSAGLLGTVGTAATAAAPAVAGTGLLGAAGAGIAGLGTAVGGAAAAVGSGIAAGASAIGAAVSAAGAAICWLARAAIPEEWMDFRKYLFTRADPELRKAYIYNARRLARHLSEEEKTQLRIAMRRALQRG